MRAGAGDAGADGDGAGSDGAGRDGAPPSLVERFRASMVMDYERWHDGIGYDVELIAAATPQERADLEQLLLARGISDWRDVEALAALATPRAHEALLRVLERGRQTLRLAVLQYAPGVANEAERVALLVRALDSARPFEGLTQVLDQVEAFHPPEIVAALLDGLRTREGEVAVHYAAMLMFLHGKASSAFEWDQRPFFLRFATDDPAEREQAVRELRERIGLEP